MYPMKYTNKITAFEARLAQMFKNCVPSYRYVPSAPQSYPKSRRTDGVAKVFNTMKFCRRRQQSASCPKLLLAGEDPEFGTDFSIVEALSSASLRPTRRVVGAKVLCGAQLVPARSLKILPPISHSCSRLS